MLVLGIIKRNQEFALDVSSIPRFLCVFWVPRLTNGGHEFSRAISDYGMTRVGLVQGYLMGKVSWCSVEVIPHQFRHLDYLDIFGLTYFPHSWMYLENTPFMFWYVSGFSAGSGPTSAGANSLWLLVTADLIQGWLDLGGPGGTRHARGPVLGNSWQGKTSRCRARACGQKGQGVDCTKDPREFWRVRNRG